MLHPKILRLNKAGTPVSWLTREETATLIVKDLVIWSLGDDVMEIRGGINRAGKQSILKLPSIVACEGKVHGDHVDPPLENKFLLAYDTVNISTITAELAYQKLEKIKILLIFSKTYNYLLAKILNTFKNLFLLYYFLYFIY